MTSQLSPVAIVLPMVTPAPVRRARIASSVVIEPSSLDAAARASLTDELYAVQAEIFGGVSREEFARYVVDSKAERTCLQLHRDEGGRLVGYLALHLYERVVSGRLSAVFRAETGVLRAFRGQRAGGMLVVREALRYRARHLLRPMYMLSSLVHPSSYALLARFYDQTWPQPMRQTPAEVEALAAQMADEFGLRAVREDRPLVRKVGWRTRDTRADRVYWNTHTSPYVRHFLQLNPGYGEGDGLLTLLVGSNTAVLRALGRLVTDRIWRKLTGRR